MHKNILVSIITPVFNEQDTIEFTIRSVLEQTYENIEYIIVDNGSTDNTLSVINKYQDKINKLLFEHKRGIYPTMNKGLKSASGAIVGVLNSDDLYADKNVIETVVNKIETNKADACWGDLLYVDRKNTNRVIRYWRSSEFSQEKFRNGWMPPHPSFFVRNWVYKKYGYFNTDFRIAADYEILVRFLEKNKITTCYVPAVFVKMRYGGMSNRSLKNLIRKSYEDYKARKINKLKGGLYTLLLKNLIKIPQFLRKYEG